MKELTLLGYFTSEPGATQALVYVPVSGRYDGCIDLEAGPEGVGDVILKFRVESLRRSRRSGLKF